MTAEQVKLGHKYFTHANDLVEVAEKIHVVEQDGTHTHHFKVRMLTVAPGHESWVGKVRRYDSRGQWVGPDGVVDRCIHDLREEACGDV